MARNGDGLFRRDGVWYFKYKDPGGVYREKSTGKKKQPEAREYKHGFLEKLRQNQLPTEEAKWSLSQALAARMEFRAATRPKASVAAEQTSCRHLNQVIGADRRLITITAWDIRRYQMNRLKTVGPKTVNNEVSVLTAVLKGARLWAPLRETYEPLQVLKRGPGQALTPEQTAKLIETAKTNDHWFVALCATVLAYATGRRSGEIKKLQLGDLVLDGNRPFIRLRAENTKGRRSRDPALNDLGLWAVNHLVARARLLGASEPQHHLLPADLSKHTKKSDPLHGGIGFDPTRHQTSWDSAWEALKLAAGFPGFRFHDLRHTHITHAIEEGVPIEVVMAQVGHVTPEMTRYYTHLGSNAKHDAVAAVQRRSSGVLEVLGPDL
ncbi:MAG TPA: site-specific integrase [Candidatus Acidoferrales bacterium]|jgi:integrase|nr:site-specific integrase [Candidatus Acidoferrales bacterium]